MPVEGRDSAYVWDMLQAVKKTLRAVEDKTLSEYLQDEDLRLVVERRIEIMGEAARRVSASLRAAHPEIPWRLIIGQRNVMAHEYDEIDHERVWKLVTAEFPRLVRLLDPLLPPIPSDEPR